MAHVIEGPAEIGNSFGYFGQILPEGMFAVVEDGEYANGGRGPSVGCCGHSKHRTREGAEACLAALQAEED